MSMDVTQLKGYDPTLYQDLRTAVEQSPGTNGSMNVYDKRLITLVNAGQSFADAVAQVKAQIPSLTPPSGMATMSLGELQSANDSFANVMATQMANVQGASGSVEMVMSLGQDVSSVIQKEQNSQADLRQLMDQMGSARFFA